MDPHLRGLSEAEASEQVLQFLGFLRWRRLKYKSLAGAKAAIRKRFLLAGRPDPTSTHALACFLKGVQRVDESGPSLRKVPITTRHLQVLHGGLDLRRRRDSAVWTAAVTAFFFMLRCSNIVAPSASKYNPIFVLCRNNLRFFLDESDVSEVELSLATAPLITRVEITVEKSKTDQRAISYSRTLGRSSHPYLCVVKALTHHLLLTADLPKAWPVTAYDPCGGDGAAAKLVVTRLLLAKAAKAAGRRLGEPASSYATHSFRIGGATAYFAAGASETFIKVLGNWASAAYLVYCWSVTNGREYQDEVAWSLAEVIRSNMARGRASKRDGGQ